MIKLELTFEQTQALLGLIDQGVRATGLKGAVPAATLAMIIENAVQIYHEEQNRAKFAPKDKDVTDDKFPGA